MAKLSPDDVAVLFLSLGVLLALARLLGEVAHRLGQASVIGELAAGIVLGPTILGRFAPGVANYLFPSSGNLAIVLDALTTLAIAFFLLVAGMEVKLSLIWRQGKVALSVATAGFVVPFALGMAAAWFAPQALGCEPDAQPRVFALFFATALAISALPVIAKTLMDLNLYRSEMGMIVIAAAVVNDLLGWIVFALVLGTIGSQSAHLSIGATIVGTLLFTVFMLTVGRWLMNRLLPWLQAYTSWPGGVLGFAFSLALIASALTEWIGIHAIFGSFLTGVAIGDSRHLREQTRQTILQFVSFIFAPLFFASIGLRVDFADKFYPTVVASVLVIACLGKIFGCALAARWAGVDRATSWALGFAMNARGAMEIILGMLALQNGLIRQRMFVALVVMAVVTSMMSGPAIQRLLRRSKAPRFTSYLHPRAFRARLQAQSPREAVGELMQLVSNFERIPADEALRAVLQREDAGATGLGDEIAVPHARLPGLTRPLLAVGISPAGIDFDAVDGRPARLVFLLLLPAAASTEALNILADIARTFHDSAAREEAIRAENYTEFLAAVRARLPAMQPDPAGLAPVAT